MDKNQLSAVINEVTRGNQTEYAHLTQVSPQQLRKLLAGTSGISGQTKTIATLLCLLKEKGLLDEAKQRLLAKEKTPQDKAKQKLLANENALFDKLDTIFK
ncbi:hypothetical protein R6242_18940 [Iodobacter sp. CM08]|uniref:hypothetical protein n=1 Tax=Iodobacter sp. CM08 TaxID=3085902 RepID=UPI0029823F0B|nr:hypothetical protein [Iodobacter sp. CM08]MDW5418646.1 hypothetical protein [Iodobacter sp. CM08]